MKHAISTRWFTNPNRGRNHFPHNLQSSYEYFIYNQGENPCVNYCLQGSCGHPIGPDVIGLKVVIEKSEKVVKVIVVSM
jgi:hypothetical protein